MLQANTQIRLTHGSEPACAGVGCRSLILGLGATGLSLARFLSSRGDILTIADTRQDPPGLDALQATGINHRLHLGEFSPDLLARIDRVFVSPGLALTQPLIDTAISRGISISSDIDLFSCESAAIDVPVIAVTGSNGKSTVTTMVGAMLAKAGKRVYCGGNLGTPALDLLEQVRREGRVDGFVIELSSFQLELCSQLQTAVAALLNISADHIDRHGSFEAYARSKARIFNGCRHAVVNRDDPLVMGLLPPALASTSFGLGQSGKDNFGLIGAGLDDRNCKLARGKEELLPVTALALEGRHNLANALAALAIADAFCVPLGPCIEALQEFRGLPHRTQLLTESDGVRWIDDSKGTNVGATVAAIEGLQGPLVLIAGGQGKRQDFAPLARALAGKTRAVVLIGEDAALLEQALKSVCPIHVVADMRAAVDLAQSCAHRGDTVLLSPACGSQDMFRDYRERGEVFGSLVLRGRS